MVAWPTRPFPATSSIPQEEAASRGQIVSPLRGDITSHCDSAAVVVQVWGGPLGPVETADHRVSTGEGVHDEAGRALLMAAEVRKSGSVELAKWARRFRASSRSERSGAGRARASCSTSIVFS